MIEKSSIIENDIVTITKASYGDNTFMPDHFHEKTAISFVLSGSIIETVHNQNTLGGIANVIIKPSRTVHRDIYSKDCSIICIYLNAENELRTSTQNLLKNWNWLHSPDNYLFLNSILKSHREKEQLECIDNFIKYFNTKKNSLNYQPPPPWVKALKNILDTSYQESLSNSELAKMFKIHPVYMARVFRKFYGQSIKTYLNVLRINGTMASILNSEEKLAHIAYDNGYADQSHLSRKFKIATGMTPRNFKHLTN